MRHAAHKKFDRKITVSEIPWPRIAAYFLGASRPLSSPNEENVIAAAGRVLSAERFLFGLDHMEMSG